MASIGPAPRYLSPPDRKGGGAPASITAANAPPPPGALLRLLRRHGFADALPPSSEAWLDSHPVFRWLAANLNDANFVSPSDAALCEALLLDSAGGGDAALRRALEDQEEDEGDAWEGEDEERTKPGNHYQQQDALLRAMGLSPAGSSASSGGRGNGDDEDGDEEGDSCSKKKNKAATTTKHPTAWLCGADDCPDVLEARVAARERAVAALEAQLSSLRLCGSKLEAASAAAAAATEAQAAAAAAAGAGEEGEGPHGEKDPSSPLLSARRRAVEAARRELSRAANQADAELDRLRSAAREVSALCQPPSAPARWLVAAADATAGNAGRTSSAMAAYAREEARMRRRFERGIALLSGPTASVRRLEGDEEGGGGQHDATTAKTAAKTPAAAAAARGVLAARRLLADGARHRDQERRNAELRRELARQRVALRCAIARQVAAREALARAEAQADAAAALAEHLEAAAGGVAGGALSALASSSSSASDPASVALLSAAAQALVPALEAGNAARLEAEVASLELERARLLSDDDAASAAAAAAALAATAAAAAAEGEASADNGSSPPANAAAAAAAASSLRSLPIPALGEAVARLNDTHVLAGEYSRQLRKMEAAAARKGTLVSALLAHGGRHLVLRSAQDAEARRLDAMLGLLNEAGAAARGMGERARARAGRYGARGGLAAGGGGGGGDSGNDNDPFARHAALLWDPSNLLSAVSSGAIDLRCLLEGTQQRPLSLPSSSASASSLLERAAREAAAALSRARADAAERVGARLPELVADAHAVVSSLFAAVFPMDEAAEEAARRRVAGPEGAAAASSSSSSAAAAAVLTVRPRLTCPAVASTMDALAELNRELGAAVNDICKEHADRLAALAGGEEGGGAASSASAAVAAARQLERRVWVLFFTAPDALAAAVDELRQRVQARQRAGL
jgi:hypothetical protein